MTTTAALLDTQAFLYILADDDRLGRKAESFFLSTEYRIHLSIAGGSEIAIKTSIGRFKMPEPLDGFLKEQIEGAFLESM